MFKSQFFLDNKNRHNRAWLEDFLHQNAKNESSEIDMKFRFQAIFGSKKS